MRRRIPPLAAVLIAYVAVALCYVFLTPLWQAPDEPAHYNYVRHLLTEARLPVLAEGDFPAQYLEELKASGFPPSAPIDGIRYESHQPPLYYLLAAPVLAAVVGDPAAVQVYALRLLSVLLGVAIVLLSYRLGRVIWPSEEGRPTVLAAVVAFIPMHTAVTAAISNDVLAEGLVIGAVVVAVRGALTPGPTPPPGGEGSKGTHGQASTLPFRPVARGSSLPTGILLGLCLLTKTTAYIALPLVLLALLVAKFRLRLPSRDWFRQVLACLLTAAVLVLPWLARNTLVYGASDPLGLARHDAIVVGQLRTSERLADVGLAAILQEAVAMTFRSFWGVFGWMGVLMDERIYLALALVVGLSLAALGHQAWGRALRCRRGVAQDRRDAYLIAVLILWGAVPGPLSLPGTACLGHWVASGSPLGQAAGASLRFDGARPGSDLVRARAGDGESSHCEHHASHRCRCGSARLVPA